MKRAVVSIGILSASLCACVVEEPPAEEASAEETSATEQAGINIQGINIQGINIQGINIQGMQMLGFRVHGASLAGGALTNVRVERGEVIAEHAGATLRGAALAGARLWAEVRDPGASPPATALVEYRITAVEPESPAYDPTSTGATYLYTLEQWVPDAGAWQPACPQDSDGRRVAIPLAAIWDERGDRIESSTLFTLGCTTGVAAKCYRWGYRPWISGYGDMPKMHWTCTRLARADYCGNGVPHTYDGTPIYVWDNLPAPGPIQKRGLLLPLGMIFEAGWGPHGAVCLSHARWISLGWLLASACPDRLIPLGLGGLACNSLLDVLDTDPSVRMFSASYLNLDL